MTTRETIIDNFRDRIAVFTNATFTSAPTKVYVNYPGEVVPQSNFTIHIKEDTTTPVDFTSGIDYQQFDLNLIVELYHYPKTSLASDLLPSRLIEFLRGFIGAQSETYGVSGVLKTFYNGDRTEVQMGEKLVIKVTANLSIRYRVAGWTT